MAKQSSSKKGQPSGKKNGGDGGKDGSGGGGYDGDGGDDREPRGEGPENISIHEAYIEHRVGGGERPTAQAYARAFDKFKKLPGAVRGKPAFRPPDPKPEKDEDGPTNGEKP